MQIYQYESGLNEQESTTKAQGTEQREQQSHDVFRGNGNQAMRDKRATRAKAAAIP